MTYKIVPIRNEVAEQVRSTMTSPFGGLPAWSSVANGYGPCRTCLKTFHQGDEERIYLTYNPFEGFSDLPLPGPVFIHTESCPEYSGDAFPAHLLNLPLILEGFGENSRLIVSEHVKAETFNEQIDEVLNAAGVEFIHLRNAEAGCFIARIEAI